MSGKADEFARLGYVGFALDVYGKGVRGDAMGDNSALMMPFLNDRAKLKQRLTAAVTAAKAHPAVDASRIAVIGYCFGGLCSLDIARSGTSDVKGVVSIHGIFAPPGLGAQGPIKSKVLVLWLVPEATKARRSHCPWSQSAPGPSTEPLNGVPTPATALYTHNRREEVSEAEWCTRVDLAAAYRLVALFGWDDLVFTDISARVPGGEGEFLIKSLRLHVRGDQPPRAW